MAGDWSHSNYTNRVFLHYLRFVKVSSVSFTFSVIRFCHSIQLKIKCCFLFLIADETDPNKKLHFQKKIDEYMTRAEQIKVQINEQRIRGEIVDKIHIIANGTGYGYETIFGKYLNDNVKEISLEEPYLREYYQVRKNLGFHYFPSF